MLLLGAVGAMASCGGTPRSDTELDRSATAVLASDTPETITYAADLKVDLTAMRRLSSGLYIQDLAPGTGDSLVPGRTAVMRYTGWLPNGTEFDSNVHGEPFTFTVGRGDVIQGWDEGVVGLRPGGKRKLVIPSDLGYGPDGAGPIPPFATLVFDIELLEIRDR